jgi:CMP-N,N'-diacetyllegionaminic acid synthase
MKIISLILARGGSKGLPRKNLLDLEGMPLVAHSIEHAKFSKYISEIYVSTDDKEIGKISSNYGAKVIWRPSELSDDLSPAEDAILHALDKIDNVDLVVFLQATSPLRESSDIDSAIEHFLDSNYDSLLSVVKLGDRFIWKEEKNKVNSISYDYKNRQRRQDIEDEYYIENGSFYIFKPKIIRKHNNRLGGNIGKYVMNNNKLLEIDNQTDYEMCKYYMRKIKWQND